MSDFITDDVLDAALAAGRTEYRRSFQMTHDPGMARLVDTAVEAAVESAIEVAAPLIAAEALREAAKVAHPFHPVGGYIPVTRDGLYDWLRARADQIEAES